MEKFFTIGFWFAQNPGALEGVARKLFLALLIVLFVGIFVFTYLKRKKSGLYFKIWRSLRSFSLANLVIGMLLFFFTEQSIPVLSSRFWFILWAIGIGTWSYFITKRFLKIPEIKEEREKQKEFNKYIP